MAKQLSDTRISNLKRGKTASERLHPAGSGSLLVIKKASGVIEFYYRKTQKSLGLPDIRIKIGNYPEVTLTEARDAANKESVRASKNPHHKETVEIERKIEKAKIAAPSNQPGTLKELCEAYTKSLRDDGKSSAKNNENYFRLNVFDKHPDIAALPANAVTTEHVVEILTTMAERKVTTALNRTRDALQAAFNFGMRFDYSPTLRLKDGLKFFLETNPVSRIPKEQKFERQLDHVIEPTELNVIWHSAPEYLNPTYSATLRVLICTGMHPTELYRLRVSDVNLTEGSMYLKNPKSENMPILVPLNTFAQEELRLLIGERDPSEPLFKARQNFGELPKPCTDTVLGNNVAKFRSKLKGVEHFTARDFRRTVKTLMGRAGIKKDIRDRLQNHSLGDTSSKHYDRYDYWPEKLAAAKVWEEWLLENVINPKKTQPD